MEPYQQHFIFFVAYEWAPKARVFVTDRPFQPSLMFVGRGKAYLSEALLHSKVSRVGSWPYQQTLDKAEKVVGPVHKLRKNKVL
jgi:hypothetical protein